MHSRTRVLAPLICVGLLLCLFSGCVEELPEESDVSLPSVSEEESAPVGEATLAVSFNADDTLNPFSTVSRANLELSSLLYEGLTRMDNTLTAQFALAASLTVEENTVTAVLRDNACFSDGTAVTAKDVATSFSLAKNSANYAVLLKNFRSATADTKQNAVVFKMEEPDVGYAACLSFPVIKASSVTDKAGQAPIGSGMYYLTESFTLAVNPHYGQTPDVTLVRLVSLSDSNALVHALENGTIGYLFTDLYGGTIPYTTAANITVDIPYMIFLGVNSSRKDLSDAQVRQAISLAVDRELLASEGCRGFARAAVSPFHPLWAKMQAGGLPLLTASDDPEGAKALLSAAGFATGLSSDKRGAKKLTLSLLINTDNPFRVTTAALLQNQFEAAGIKLNLVQKSYAEYVQTIEKGDFDLYLGEVRLPVDGSLRSFFEEDGGTSFGIRTSGTCATAYADYLAGKLTLAQFLTVFDSELPFIPLNWQKGMAAFKRSYQNIIPSVLDPYYGLGFWDIN